MIQPQFSIFPWGISLVIIHCLITFLWFQATELNSRYRSFLSVSVELQEIK